nr:hypothetical protein BHE74_00042261 [Ensete ventricosum]
MRNPKQRFLIIGCVLPIPAASLGSGSIPSAKIFSSSRSPPPAALPIPTPRKNVPSIRNKKLSPPLFHKDKRRPSNWRVEISIAGAPGEVVNDEKLHNIREHGGSEGNIRSRLETRRMLFERNHEDTGNKLAGLKSASRMVPFQETGSLESPVGANTKDDELNAGHKDSDLSLIRMQLVQIENQQSNLLELLQVAHFHMRNRFPIN